MDDVKSQMDKVVKHLEAELSQLQIWRASTNLVDNINVYVSNWWMEQKLNQLSSTTILDSQSIKIQPWDKSILSDIEKSINESWLWLNPINQWDYIIINVPPLTWERRQELSKYVWKTWEESKKSLRNIRHDALKKIKTMFEDKEISEDEKDAKEDNLDDIIKEYTAKIEKHVKNKADEIMKV